jgi:hypothetical protein
MMRGNRAKSKSPNPSFCSVLNRVKDWELGAFTPKTALADNVDVMNRSNVPFSDSDREMSDQGESRPGSDLAGPWPSGSPTREGGKEAGGGGGTAGVGDSAGVGEADKNDNNATSGLVKSALNSNIGKKRVLPLIATIVKNSI